MSATNEDALALVDRDLARLGQSVAHRRDVVRVARAFLASAVSLEAVERVNVERFLAERRKTGLSATTQANELSRLRSFFVALVRLGLATGDPTAGLSVKHAPVPHVLVSEEGVARLLAAALDVPPHERGYLVGALKRERGCAAGHELEALLAATAKRDRAALELLYGLGVRSAELRAALVVDLDLVDGTLLVRRAKRGQPEHLPLPPASLAHVRAWLEARPRLLRGEDEGRLLVRNDGRPYSHGSQVAKLVDRVAKRAGVRVHAHALRRGVATHLVRAGAPVAAVQRLLGHESLETTALYVEVNRDDLRRAVSVLDRGEPPA